MNTDAMKFLFGAFALSLVTAASAQSREDTHAWILEQSLAMNPPNLTYRIEGGEFMSEVSLGAGASSLGATPVQKAIPLNQVTRITVTQTDRYLSYGLSCDKPCAYLVDEPSNRQDRFLFELYRKVDAGFPARMNKALLHLVKLHGGRATAVTTQAAPKPTF
ncbi:hypothetical protein [Hydrogenophaga sp.]|uniref:hypothetical protein n=1 Tax=Hydrogenophaga sp. TaxID=1904254 RepID=UPI0027218A93|nr:hypothetical protein [Hydrogenophaga sp.]MDO9437314.1 hypothetical protein [Hydrogenophaga sp.]